MWLINDWHQALTNLLAAKLRSSLAVLGILVGTAAVVALISCGQLATEKALEQFKALGTDLLAVTAYERSENNTNSGKHTVSLNTWRELPARIPEIKTIAPYATAYQTISYQGHVFNGSVIGADEKLADIIKINLAQGGFVSFLHTFDQVCVIGHNLAEQIKSQTNEEPLGKQIRVGNSLYTIIGITSPWQESSFFNEDINTAVIIPVAGIAMVSQDPSVNNAIMLLNPESDIDKISTEIKESFQEKSPKLTIYIRSAKQLIASMESQGQIFTLLLAIIGGVSLLVGGIGVMNVMLVSVTERKKEIGIRKAVGAKNREIQTLFLMESILLSILGGSVGVLLGLGFTAIVSYFNQWHFTLHLLPPLAGFTVSVATGIFFGFYPARRASLLEPVISLRASL